MVMAGCGTSDYDFGSDWHLPPTAETLEMIAVPGGTFQRDETTDNLSAVSAFRMSKTEITRDQFMDVMGAYDPSNTTNSTGYDDPVQNITWYDAVEFCIRLSRDERRTPVYALTDRVPAEGYPITSATVVATWSHDGYRLPTSMEWIWASMGATSGSGYTSGIYTTGYAKPFAGSNATNAAGDNGTNAIGDYAWTKENSPDNTQPAGTRLANELGLHDLSGNVWEWCWDRYDYPYPTGTLVDYRGAPSGMFRVVHGGGWANPASSATLALRVGNIPGTPNPSLGFRVVRQ